MAEMKKLSEIAELTVGYVGTMGKEYSEEGVLFLRSLNIKPFGFDLSDVKYIPRDFNERLKKSELHAGDVVIVRTGVPGTCAVISEELDGCNCADLVIIHPDKARVNPYYLCAFINSWGRAQVSNVKVGAVQKHFNVTSAAEMLIPLISIEEQQSIASLLFAINDRIDNNTAICTDLESMAKLLYDYWFVQFDFPDENGKPYKSSGGKMVWNEELKREIPKKWEVKPLPNVCDLRYGFPLNTELFGVDGKSVIRIRDITDNTVSAKTTENVGTEYLTCAGDLLVGMDGNFQMNYWTRDNEIVNQRIARIRQIIQPLMVIRMQIEPYITAKVSSVARSTVGHLSDADFKKQLILCPDDMDYSFFENSLNTIVELRNENQQLSTLRDFLLPMLMNGQVKVGKA